MKHFIKAFFIILFLITSGNSYKILEDEDAVLDLTSDATDDLDLLSRHRRSAINVTVATKTTLVTHIDYLYCGFDLTPNTTQNCTFLMNAERLGLHKWILSRGSESHWRGGPTEDGRSEKYESGYAMARMTHMISKNYSAWMMTKRFSRTGADGKCLSFKYSSDGLNVKKLEVLLVYFDDYKLCTLNITNNCTNGSVIASTSFEKKILWNTQDTTGSKWTTTKVTFSRDKPYHIAIVGHATNQFPENRGYIAVDEISLVSGPCLNDCLFDKDFCKWTVDSNATFPWILQQSADKVNRGPSRDQGSSVDTDIVTGSYAFVENTYPRRGGDKARLLSSMLNASDSPMCFRFWSEMHGTNMGILRVLLQNSTNGTTTEIWSKEPSIGEVGWSPSQVTLSTNDKTDYRVIIEAEINQPTAGGIALDTLTIQNGSCPVFPHASGKGMSVLDCSFDVGSCSWTWIQPSSLTSTFLAMILKVSSADRKMDGHSWRPSNNPDSYVLFDFSSYKHRVRDSGHLVSPTLLGKNEDLCLSFWAYMNSNVFTDPIVGSLSVIMRLSQENITLWRITNQQYSTWFQAKVPVKANQPFQLMIKGTKGSKRGGTIAIDDIVFYHHKCEIDPAKANVEKQDCSFDDNSCGWLVESMPAGDKPPAIEKGWRYTGEKFGLSVVYDHTYAGDNAGYVYLESFNEEVLSSLVSPYFEDNSVVCLTFFYISLSKDYTASLSIFLRNQTDYMFPVWKVTQKDLMNGSPRHIQTNWKYAQVSFSSNKSQILIMAHVKTGGWAIDDIRVLDDKCSTSPKIAKPMSVTPFKQKSKPLKLSKVPTTEDLKTDSHTSTTSPKRPSSKSTSSALSKLGGGSGAASGAKQASSSSHKIKTDSETSVLLPRTEIDGPQYTGFEKSGFGLSGSKKSRLGRSVSRIMERLYKNWVHQL